MADACLAAAGVVAIAGAGVVDEEGVVVVGCGSPLASFSRASAAAVTSADDSMSLFSSAVES